MRWPWGRRPRTGPVPRVGFSHACGRVPAQNVVQPQHGIESLEFYQDGSRVRPANTWSLRLSVHRVSEGRRAAKGRGAWPARRSASLSVRAMCTAPGVSPCTQSESAGMARSVPSIAASFPCEMRRTQRATISAGSYDEQEFGEGDRADQGRQLEDADELTLAWTTTSPRTTGGTPTTVNSPPSTGTTTCRSPSPRPARRSASGNSTPSPCCAFGLAGRLSSTKQRKEAVIANLEPVRFTQLANITGRPAISGAHPAPPRACSSVSSSSARSAGTAAATGRATRRRTTLGTSGTAARRRPVARPAFGADRSRLGSRQRPASRAAAPAEGPPRRSRSARPVPGRRHTAGEGIGSQHDDSHRPAARFSLLGPRLAGTSSPGGQEPSRSRITERVRARGRSGSSPFRAATASASRCTRTRSA